MSMQMSDMIFLPYKNKKYCILAYENDWPINIENFNIKPVLEATLSCNWKGYESEYTLENNKYLYWDSLMFRAKDGIFPEINGVKAELIENEFEWDGKKTKIHFREYKNIMKVPYTGGLILGSGIVGDSLHNCGYLYPHAYEEVLECIFKCGELIDIKDHSLKMAVVRNKLNKRFIFSSRKFSYDNYYSHSYKDKWDIYKRW